MKSVCAFGTWWTNSSSTPRSRISRNHAACWPRSAEHQDAACDVFGAHVGCGGLELVDVLEVGHERRVEDVRAPLVERSIQRRIVVLGPRDLHLHVDRLPEPPPSRNASITRAQLLVRHVHGDQPIGPRRRTTAPSRGSARRQRAAARDRAASRAGRARRARATSMSTSRPREQSADHVGALAEASVARGLVWPRGRR